MIKYGILSTASIVERFVNGIRESHDGEVIAIASRSLEKAREHAKKLNISQYYGSYEELYEDDNIDVIYVPTVNSRHYRDCKNALEHHKHVIVEKPFVLKPEQVKELFALAKRNHCFLMEGQKSVFLPTTRKISEVLNNQMIGKVKYIEFKASFPGRFNYDHWMYDLNMGGGALYGSATYTIELLQYLFDDPEMIISGTAVACPTGADEICSFQLVLNQEILVSSTIAMNVATKNEAVFYGEHGYIVVPNFWKSNQFDIVMNDGQNYHFNFPYNSEFVYEINHANHCIEQRLLQSPIMNEKKTLKTVELVSQFYQQWQSNKSS